MKTKIVENTLALAGALITLIGVSFAATSAFADDSGTARAAATRVESTAPERPERSASAARKAADEAANSLARDNRVDLEIRLLDRTSTSVARQH